MQKFKITYKDYDVHVVTKEVTVEGTEVDVNPGGSLAILSSPGTMVMMFAAGEWISIEKL